MAETGAGAPQVVWGQFVDAGASRGGGDNIPQHFGRHAFPQTRPALLIARDTGPLRDGRRACPLVDVALHRAGNGDRAHVSAHADQIGNHPVLFALLN
jgi:hypothetical protein